MPKTTVRIAHPTTSVTKKLRPSPVPKTSAE